MHHARYRWTLRETRFTMPLRYDHREEREHVICPRTVSRSPREAYLHRSGEYLDPLSARIAHLLDYEVCFLSGSVGKAANLGVPDMVLSNMSDLVDHCRRITRIADVSLMVDGEDGFGNAVNVARTVRELEAAGVAAIEIEDNIAPVQFNGADRGLVSQAEQVGKLEAAVAARTDPTTVIVARTAALAYCALDEALDRMQAYAQTGAEVLRLVGLHTRAAA